MHIVKGRSFSHSFQGEEPERARQGLRRDQKPIICLRSIGLADEVAEPGGEDHEDGEENEVEQDAGHDVGGVAGGEIGELEGLRHGGKGTAHKIEIEGELDEFRIAARIPGGLNKKQKPRPENQKLSKQPEAPL
jgi:hypothetical protein